LSLMLYCIGAAAELRRIDVAPPPQAPASLQWLTADPLVALVADAPAGADVDTLLAFAEVIAHYHAHVNLVPMRWGSRLADADAVIAHLHAEVERYQALLAVLADCVELSVRLALPESPASADTTSGTDVVTGRSYLLRRRQQLRTVADAEAALTRIDGALAGLYRQTRREQGWLAGCRRLSAHYLVPRAQLALFRRRLAAALAAEPVQTAGLAPLTSGPWPPHSFAVDATATTDAVRKS